MLWIVFYLVFKFLVRLFHSLAGRGYGAVVPIIVVAARVGAAAARGGASAARGGFMVQFHARQNKKHKTAFFSFFIF